MPLKKTNGLYRGKVRIGVTQDGKPIDKFVSGKTVKELEIAKEAARGCCTSQILQQPLSFEGIIT